MKYDATDDEAMPLARENSSNLRLILKLVSLHTVGLEWLSITLLNTNASVKRPKVNKQCIINAITVVTLGFLVLKVVLFDEIN
uniref:Uncharacterized protein n=1 Tax=Glossina palpalis gambiensis TaxID=67801 RepID=A0A1B0BBM0_9MUSC